MNQISQVLKKIHGGRESLSLIMNMCLGLNEEQITNTIFIIKKKFVQLRINYYKTYDIKKNFDYIYDVSNTEQSKLPKLPKLIHNVIKEFIKELKTILDEINILNICLVLLNDILIIEKINKYPFVDTKIDKTKYVKTNILFFNKKSVNRFSITIRNFIDNHLNSTCKNLFPPMITSILGRSFHHYELSENNNYCMISYKDYYIRSYDLSLVEKITQRISSMITCLKNDIYNVIYGKNYLTYCRIFLLKKKFIFPTDLIRNIYEFIGPIELEQKQKQSDDSSNIYFIRKLLKEIKT
jgi:hypothetical protein